MTIRTTGELCARSILQAAALSVVLVASAALADDNPYSASTFSALRLRGIGPALTGGRVGDIAVDPRNHAHYYIAVSSGGVWETNNAGTTWKPIFDSQGSYSIGCVAVDPGNPNVVWVGTGENNSQRSVAFGDGVYRSLDGGRNWKNMGLRDSEHIGMIVVDPRDSNTVYVAAQGPLWRSGGDRGLYKTTDGGETWELILYISEHTGVNEVHIDPRDPDTLYASSYQRRRRVWTQISGGPESTIYKSSDRGTTWREISRGLPGGDKGRIGMDISPVNPDVLYAIVEAGRGSSGFYRSTDRGETWQRRSSYITSAPMYYNEIFCDPSDVDTVYALDTLLNRTEDGGATFSSVPRRNRHVDDHALWIDPENPRHLIVGCDGGVYDSWDRGGNWNFKPNLPITQFYRVAVDNSEPFYYVYGGTQDNNTLGGPSRARSGAGITNEEWFVTVGGDGFETVVDPEDPNIVYSQWQHGGLVRHDRRSGENVDIKPRERPGDEPYVWNWDSPIVISPHSHTRLYFGAQQLFRSDDRGNSWTPISDNLTRKIDRNTLEVMGKVWPRDAVGKHDSTSIYGNLVSLSESSLVEGLIYVGTDDGLIQVTEDGGENWREIAVFPHVPDMTYVSFLAASGHDENTVYAAFDNHKNGDFNPYLLRSNDRGHTWELVSGDLPDRNIVYAVAEDHVRPELLFVGTEFGAYFTLDGGEHWMKLGGMPTIAVRDVEIQRRENDVALATFGRGFYILDDYSPLQHVTPELLEEDALIFPIKDALLYIQGGRLGWGLGSQGASFYAAPNPPFGAVFTYHLKSAVKPPSKDGDKNPTIEEMREKERQISPQIILTIRDGEGEIVRQLNGSGSKGMHRTTWNLRHAGASPIELPGSAVRSTWAPPSGGPLALPGTYTVEIARLEDGAMTTLAGPESFEVVSLDLATFTAADGEAVLAYRKKAARLQSALQASMRVADDASSRLASIRKAILDTPHMDSTLVTQVDALVVQLDDMMLELRGDRLRSREDEPTAPSISQQVRFALSNQNVTSGLTQTQEDAYQYAAEAFAKVLAELRTLVEDDIAALETALEEAGAPWTPGRLPDWQIED